MIQIKIFCLWLGLYTYFHCIEGGGHTGQWQASFIPSSDGAGVVDSILQTRDSSWCCGWINRRRTGNFHKLRNAFQFIATEYSISDWRRHPVARIGERVTGILKALQHGGRLRSCGIFINGFTNGPIKRTCSDDDSLYKHESTIACYNNIIIIIT